MDKIIIVPATKVSILENVTFKNGKKQGNTTRQIDKAIELLYEGHIVVCEDHYKDGQSRQANINLFKKVLHRLECEHNLEYLMEKKKIKINLNELTIELV
jgi:hypothetical protein